MPDGRPTDVECAVEPQGEPATRRILLGIVLILAFALAWLVYRLNDVPSLEPWRGYELEAASGPDRTGEIRVTFLGVSTLLVSDGETALLTDGFFTRPGLLRVLLGKLEPSRETIARALARAGIGALAALIVVHSHYDHVMDAPEVARRTGAALIGSESTANVGRGWGLAEARIRAPRSGETLRFGAFRVTLVRSEHFPHGMAMGEIREPLVPPVRALDYLEGGSYSVLIEHALGNVLVHASAGWREGALAGSRADVVLLGVGGLGTRDEAYREAYFREVVEAVGARLVIPIHWDDFTRPLDRPLRPMPTLQDDFEATMRFLARKAEASPDLALAMLPSGKPVRLFGADRQTVPATPARRY